MSAILSYDRSLFPIQLMSLLAVAMAAITQFWALGGVVGLAVAANVLNNHVRAALSVVLQPAHRHFSNYIHTLNLIRS